MIRETSVETYRLIKSQGLLSKMRMYVYDLIYEHQPINISQLILKAQNVEAFVNTGSISGRISELVEAGVIYEKFTGACPITGHNTIFWATNDSLPNKIKKNVEPVLYYCSVCQRGGWHNDKPHTSLTGQYCMGKIKMYREIKRNKNA